MSETLADLASLAVSLFAPWCLGNWGQSLGVAQGPAKGQSPFPLDPLRYIPSSSGLCAFVALW